jgi:hypothetical protein
VTLACGRGKFGGSCIELKQINKQEDHVVAKTMLVVGGETLQFEKK